MSKLKIEELLFNDQPITINRKLAKCLGITESIIFQQIHYWLKINEKTNNNFKENKYWVYNSIPQWKEKEFDFLSESTIKRTLQKLEKLGLLDVGVFNKMKGDKTKWYTINYNKLLEVCEKVESEKNELSDKRKVAGKLAAEARKNKSDNKNTMGSSWSDGGASVQLDPTMGSSWSDDGIKLVRPIPETTTKITTKISFSSSSSGHIDLIEKFQDSICELKKTTKTKFLKYCDSCKTDLIESILHYAADININTYAGFETIINTALKNNISTGEEFLNSIEQYRNAKKKKPSSTTATKTKSKTKDLKFNNFDGRDYNYDNLEKKLLGWEEDGEDNSIYN